MSLNGISGTSATIFQPTETRNRPAVEQERAQTAVAGQQAQVQARKVVGAGLLAPRHEVLPAEAPEGTDPELWQMLTTEERSHFAKMTAMGPLTYGRMSRDIERPVGNDGVRRGGRIDVRA